MEPQRLRACEALAKALALNHNNDARTGATSSAKQQRLPQPNEQQKDMRIPPHLIYIAGLLGIHNKSTPFSPEIRQIFSDLQELYHQTLLKISTEKEEIAELKIFHLSPSLLPNPSDQSRIQQDIDAKIHELEDQAKQMEEELLKEQAAEKESKNIKQIAKKKTSPKPLIKSRELPKEEKEIVEKQPTETLQQVLAQIQLPQTEEDDVNAEDWVPVYKKKAKAVVSTSSVQLKEVTTKPAQADNELRPNYQRDASFEWPEDENVEPRSKKIHSSGAGTAASVVQENEIEKCGNPDAETPLGENTNSDRRENIGTTKDECINEKIEIPVVAEGNVTDSDANKNKSTSTIKELEERIRQLERSLAQSENDRVAVEAKHAQELRAEQEKSEERIQALSLRLYISETRLKTYEDALEQHVVAVANNVATGSPNRQNVLSFHHQNRNEWSAERSPSSPWRPLSRAMNQYQSVTKQSND